MIIRHCEKMISKFFFKLLIKKSARKEFDREILLVRLI